MTSNTNETFNDTVTFPREPGSRSQSVSAFLTSVIASRTKEGDGCPGNGTVRAPRAKRPRSSCRRSWTSKERGRGKGKRSNTARTTAPRADTTRFEQDAEEEEELARISGSSSGESDDGAAIAVTDCNTAVDRYPSKQDELDASHAGTVASFLRVSHDGRKLDVAGQPNSSSCTATRSTLTTERLPSRGRKRRRGLTKKSNFGANELDIVDTSSDSDSVKVESAAAVCTSGNVAMHQWRKQKEKEPDSAALKMALPSHHTTHVACAEAPSVSVTTSSRQVEVDDGGGDMSMFVQSVHQLGEDEEGAPMREYEAEQILTSDSHSSAGGSPCRTEQKAGEWLKGQHLNTPGSEVDDSIVPAQFESTKKKARFIRGGLAERLRRLASREASDISFWEHSCRQGGKGVCDSSQDTHHLSGDRSNPITVEVTFITHYGSLFIADCIVKRSSGRDVMTCSSGSLGRTVPSGEVHTPESSGVCQVGEEIKVIFTQRSAKFVVLGIGSTIQICPPWYWVDASSGSGSKVLIGAHFSSCVVAAEEPVCHPDNKKGSSLPKDSIPKKLFD